MDKTMTVTKTRTFRSGNSEAVRLPKNVAFGEGVELVIVRSGDVLTLYPAATSIPEMIARLETLPVQRLQARDHLGDGGRGGVKRQHVSGANDDQFDALPEGDILGEPDGLGIAAPERTRLGDSHGFV